MNVSFKNNYPAQVWIAIKIYDPDSCSYSGNWRIIGWYPIAPGEKAFVFSTNNRYAYYYAEADDGAYWAGDYGPVAVFYEAFNNCRDDATSAAEGRDYERVWMRKLKVCDEDTVFTLNL